MKKRMDFSSAEESRLDEKARQVLGREFEVPESVKKAQQEAFAEIRMLSREKAAGEKKKEKRRFFTIPKTAGGLAAAAAVFSVICISNPALAEDIPLLGNVFQELGSSLGFSGDYSEYAKPLASAESEETAVQESAAAEGETEGAAEAGTSADSLYTKTSEGVTISLSEIYCNDESLNLSMVIHSEEPFPETLEDQFGKKELTLTAHQDSASLSFSYNPDFEFLEGDLDGEFIDENTYAGVLRLELSLTDTDDEKADEYYEARDAFLREKGFDPDNMTVETLDEIAQALGMEEYTDAGLGAVGGPAMEDYFNTVEIPESFSIDLNIHEITGLLPESNIPEIPQELKDEYDAAMGELGLNEDDYENFTEEQKEQEHQLFKEMMNQYYELYPEVSQYYNSYNSWSLKGEWDFHVDVEIDHTKTVTKEVNDIDEDGIGVASVTKTPFELSMSVKQGSDLCFVAVLDANGELMSEYGNSTDTLAVQDHDVSKIDIYICDYVEYMDELKGYYWNDNIEESGYGSFKELLEARALHHTEVVFEE